MLYKNLFEKNTKHIKYLYRHWGYTQSMNIDITF